MYITYNYHAVYIHIYIYMYAPAAPFFIIYLRLSLFLLPPNVSCWLNFLFASLKWFQNSTFLHGLFSMEPLPHEMSDVSWLMDFLWPCILGSKLLRCSTHLDVDQPQVGPSFWLSDPTGWQATCIPVWLKEKRVLLIKVIQQNAWILNDSKSDVFVHTLYVFSVTLHIHIFNLFQLLISLFVVPLNTQHHMGTVSKNSSYRKKSAFSFSWHDFRIPKKKPGILMATTVVTVAPTGLFPGDAVCSHQRGDQDCKARCATHDLGCCFHWGKCGDLKSVRSHSNAGNMAHVTCLYTVYIYMYTLYIFFVCIYITIIGSRWMRISVYN